MDIVSIVGVVAGALALVGVITISIVIAIKLRNMVPSSTTTGNGGGSITADQVIFMDGSSLATQWSALQATVKQLAAAPPSMPTNQAPMPSTTSSGTNLSAIQQESDGSVVITQGSTKTTFMANGNLQIARNNAVVWQTGTGQ
jgi:hypothetical protein